MPQLVSFGYVINQHVHVRGRELAGPIRSMCLDRHRQRWYRLEIDSDDATQLKWFREEDLQSALPKPLPAFGHVVADRDQLVAAFAVWHRRYRMNPENYVTHGTPAEQGEGCADELIAILEELA